MINIAIVEDDDSDAALLENCLSRYFLTNGRAYSISRFKSAQTFLVVCKKFDLVFLDIELPEMDGMTAAEEMRKSNEFITLIFVTNMGQLAIKGYAVDALDFIVKPVVYENFVVKLRKALARVAENSNREISVSVLGGGVQRMLVSSVRYVEIIGHNISYHTDVGVVQSYGTLKSCEDLLGDGFARCNSCYLVNLKYVNGIKGYTVNVDGQELKVSQPKKKSFIKALNEYFAGGGGHVPFLR